MLLEGQVAIVTGGGRGIGRAIARCFAAEGAAVVIAARSAIEIEAVAADIRSRGGRTATVAAHVEEEADCDRIVRTAHKHFKQVDILVNNAGIFGPVKPVEEISLQEWDEAFAINLRSAFLLTKMVLPEMYARGSGAILNVSSVAAKMAYTWEAPYAASKAGMLGLTRCVAAEAARKGVRVNAICPGPVFETKMSRDLGRALASKMGISSEEQIQQYTDTLPMGRGLSADEIAAAALFLVSKESSAMTAQVVNVDGGLALY